MAVARQPRGLPLPASAPSAADLEAVQATPPSRPWLRWLSHVVVLLAIAAVLLTLA